MKITVITRERGKIVGAFHGHAKDYKIRSSGPTAFPVPGPHQHFHELDVPEDVLPREANPDTLAAFPKRVKKYLPKPRPGKARR